MSTEPAPETTPPTKRMALAIVRSDGAGWVVFPVGVQHVIGRFVSLSEACRYVRTRRWRFAVDCRAFDEHGETIRTFAVELPKSALVKAGERVG